MIRTMIILSISIIGNSNFVPASSPNRFARFFRCSIASSASLDSNSLSSSFLFADFVLTGMPVFCIARTHNAFQNSHMLSFPRHRPASRSMCSTALHMLHSLPYPLSCSGLPFSPMPWIPASQLQSAKPRW